MAVAGKTGEKVGDTLTGFTVDLDARDACSPNWPIRSADPAALLGNATTRVVYDIDAYQRTSGQRTALAAVDLHIGARDPFRRSPGGTPGATTQFQHAFAYSDGFGREIQRKALVADGSVTAGGAVVSPRWVGSGWTIFNNKGRPVRTLRAVLLRPPTNSNSPPRPASAR